MIKNCKFDGCDKNAKVLGYCPTHYAGFKYWNNPSPSRIHIHKHKCILENCNNLSSKNDLCGYHSNQLKYRKKRNLSTDLTINLGKIYHPVFTMRGKNNPRWNGGKSEYKDHYLMKLARKEKIKKTNGLCEICGKKGFHVHHLDGSKNNHNINNLQFLCTKCHGKTYHNNGKPSEHKKKYGFTQDQLMKMTGLNWNEIKILYPLDRK